jgi:hypothetical protein
MREDENAYGLLESVVPTSHTWLFKLVLTTGY